MRFQPLLGLALLVLVASCGTSTPSSDESQVDSTQVSTKPGTLPSTVRAFEMLDQPTEQTYENPLDEAQRLRDDFRLAEALQVYNKVLERDPTNYEALWRKSTIISEMGFLIANGSIKENYYAEALKVAQKALGVAPEALGSNFAMALALGRMESVVDDHRKVTFAVKMKKHAQKVLDMDSTYHYAWYLLGSWSYDFAGLEPTDYNVAKSLFGTKEMDNATYEHAVGYFEKALSYEPDNVVYNYHAAMAYIQVGEDEKAMDYLRKAVREPLDTKKEEEFIRKFNQMIAGNQQ